MCNAMIQPRLTHLLSQSRRSGVFNFCTEFAYCSGVSVFEFEQVNAGRVTTIRKWGMKKENENIQNYINCRINLVSISFKQFTLFK